MFCIEINDRVHVSRNLNAPEKWLTELDADQVHHILLHVHR